MADGDANSPEALALVACRLCQHEGIENMFARKALTGHLGAKHKGIKKADYIARWPQGAEDFWNRPVPTEERQKLSNEFTELNHARKRTSVNGALELLVAANREGLDDDEQEFYDEFFEQILQQTDRDETQMPIIASMTFDHIMVKRMRTRLLSVKKNAKAEDILANGEIEKQLKTTEERIAKTMDNLGISRAAQLKRGAIIKSTPSSIISGYLDEIERMSPEMLDALQLEEKRVYASMSARVAKFILSEAPDIEKEDESDAGSGKPLSLDEALGRAGIVAGGGYVPPEQPESERDLPF